MLSAAITGPVETELREFESLLNEVVRSDVVLIDQAIGHVLALRGKRIRPIVLLLCSHLDNQKPGGHLESAVAVELLHTATLVHDDVVDESDIRRGGATLNSIWDNKVSVLIGDYMFAKALDVALRTGNPRVLEAISEASQRMSQGELLQIQNDAASQLNTEVYFRVITDKTASLLAASCKLGGLAAGATNGTLNQLGKLGEKIGIAFQIKDDLLDYTGSEQTLGKPPAQDLREGKATLPLLKALENATEAEKDLVRSFLNGSYDETALDSIVEFVLRRGGAEAALEVARSFRDEAHAVLNTFPSSPYREALNHVIDFVVEREN